MKFNTAQAAEYDELSILLEPFIEGLFERLPLFIKDPKKILDLGSTTGWVTDKLQKHYLNSTVLGVEARMSLINLARRKYPELNFLHGDPLQCDFKTERFDLIICHQLSMESANFQEIFVRAKHLLAEQGVFAFLALGPDTLGELRSVWQVNEFTDMHMLGDSLRDLRFMNVILERQNFEYAFADVYELLHTLKALGSINPNACYKSFELFENLNAAYPKTAEDCIATVELIYGFAQQPELSLQSTDEFGEVRFSVEHLKSTRARFS